jgi:hypothetical protein
MLNWGVVYSNTMDADALKDHSLYWPDFSTGSTRVFRVAIASSLSKVSSVSWALLAEASGSSLRWLVGNQWKSSKSLYFLSWNIF